MKRCVSIDYEIDEEVLRDIVVNIDYEPGRAAPVCSDPNLPAFSDPGEPIEINSIDAFFKDGTQVPIEITSTAEFEDAVLDAIANKERECVYAYEY